MIWSSLFSSFLLCTTTRLENSVSYKAGTSKISSSPRAHLIKSLVKEGNEQFFFAKTDSLVDKIMSCPPINSSNSQTFLLDGVEAGVLLSDFADVPVNYFTLLDVAGRPPTLVVNHNVEAEDRVSWVPFTK